MVYEQTGKSYYQPTSAWMSSPRSPMTSSPVGSAADLRGGCTRRWGDSAWFSDEPAAVPPIWPLDARGCQLAGAVWGGGETPALQGRLSTAHHRARRFGGGADTPQESADYRRGVSERRNVIILLATQRCPRQRPDPSAATRPVGLPDRICHGVGRRPHVRAGRLFDPSVIYVPFIAACQRAGHSTEIRGPHDRPRTGEGKADGGSPSRSSMITSTLDIRRRYSGLSRQGRAGDGGRSLRHVQHGEPGLLAAYVSPPDVGRLHDGRAGQRGMNAWVGVGPKARRPQSRRDRPTGNHLRWIHAPGPIGRAKHTMDERSQQAAPKRSMARSQRRG